MKWVSVVLVGAVLLSVLGMVPDGHASTSWPKEVVKDYAQGKQIDALKGVTDQVQGWSEYRACQDPHSWGCVQTQDLGEKTDIGWTIIGFGLTVALPVKVAALVLR